MSFYVALTSEPVALVTASVEPVLVPKATLAVHGGPARYEGAPLGPGSTYEVVHTRGVATCAARPMESRRAVAMTPSSRGGLGRSAAGRDSRPRRLGRWLQHLFYGRARFRVGGPELHDGRERSRARRRPRCGPAQQSGVRAGVRVPVGERRRRHWAGARHCEPARDLLEPYYGYVGYFGVYLTSQPKDTVLLTITSSLPAEAGRGQPARHPRARTGRRRNGDIASIDDPVADGDRPLNITISTLGTEDPDYGGD